MGILDKGEGAAAPLGADYEHREEYRPPLWYRRGEERNPFLRQKKSSGKEKGHTMGMGKGNTKATNMSGVGVGTTGNAQQVLSAVRAGHGAGREIATATGLSVQMVGALLSRLSQSKVISKGPDGRWVDLLAPVTKVAKPTRKAAPKGTGLPDESELQKKILSQPVPTHAVALPRQSDLAGPITESSLVQSQPVVHRQPTVKVFAKDFARVMANSRQLNERVGEMLEIIQDIRAVNDALTAEWGGLQERLAALEKAS